jgi:uncharacterized membrane protein (DUF485 family)
MNKETVDSSRFNINFKQRLVLLGFISLCTLVTYFEFFMNSIFLACFNPGLLTGSII